MPQELLSAEKTPTLSLALPIFELLIIKWLELQTELPELGHYIGVGIAKIQEYVIKGRKSRIYALAMSTSLQPFKFTSEREMQVINPTMKLGWIQEHWPADDAHKAEEWMIDTVRIMPVRVSFPDVFKDDCIRHRKTARKCQNLAENSELPNLPPPSLICLPCGCCPVFWLCASGQ
jgi:hypothetical protein